MHAGRYVLNLDPEQMKALAIAAYYISGGERSHPTTLDTAAAFAKILENGHESDERVTLVHETMTDLWEEVLTHAYMEV